MTGAGQPGPVVSVVIPCYRQAQFLPEAVGSVVGQTYPAWEAIIVDDGSPDDTASVAEELIERHGDRIRLIRQENAGLAAARNAGIGCARGRYILPLDADDRLGPRMLERTTAVLEADPGVAAVYVDLERFGAANGPVELWDLDPDILTVQNHIPYASLYRRSAWEACGGYRSDLVWGYEDWDLWLAFASRGMVMQRCPETLFYYRVRPGSMIATAEAHHDELVRILAEHHPDFFTRRRRAVGRAKLAVRRLVRRGRQALGQAP